MLEKLTLIFVAFVCGEIGAEDKHIPNGLQSVLG